MSLVDITRAIQAQMVVANDPRIPAGLTFQFGGVKLAHHDAPPRIVWVPMESPVEGAEKGGTAAFTPQNPTQILTRRQRVDAHVWMADPDKTDPLTQLERDFIAAEALADATWYAIHEVTGRVYTPVSYDVGNPDNLQYGWLFILSFDVKIPITKPADPDTVINSNSVTGEIVNG